MDEDVEKVIKGFNNVALGSAFMQKEWISMKDFPPPNEGRILYKADECGDECGIGIAIPEMRRVFLKCTDLSFDDITWWYPIPSRP